MQIFFDYLIPIFKYVAGAYLLLLIALYFLQGFLIFVPYANDAPQFKDFPFKDKTTTLTIKGTDGVNVTSWMIAPPSALTSASAVSIDTAAPIIIFFHGNATHALYGAIRAHGFMQAGYGFVMAEYRGYGGNKGRPAEKAIYDDTLLLVQRVKATFPDHPIYLYGESIGTGIATQMATEFDIAGLILEAPFTSITDVAQSLYPFVPVRYLLRHRFENIDKISTVHAPVLIIHGAQDTVIPAPYGKRLFEAASQPKTFKLIDEAGHNDLLMHDAMAHSLSFIKENTAH